MYSQSTKHYNLTRKPFELESQRAKPPKKHISSEFIRLMALNPPANVPCFVCPGCNKRYAMNYGTFGRIRNFEQPTYYCKCCAKGVHFVKC